jgi:pilus assembly protein Flp/PilA
MKKLMKYLKEEEGIVAIEYGLIAAAIAVAISLIVWQIGDQIVVIFESIRDALFEPVG